MIKQSYIRQISKSRWRVFSEKGKNLGTFPSKSKAKERLKQVEMFKHTKKKSNVLEGLLKISESIDKKESKKEIHYSKIMRKLRKDYNKEDIKKFQKTFKDQFELSLEKELKNPENIALIAAMKAIDFEE